MGQEDGEADSMGGLTKEVRVSEQAAAARLTLTWFGGGGAVLGA